MTKTQIRIDTRRINLRVVRSRFKSGLNHAVKYVGAKPKR